jgi:hypothetical protein
VSRGPCGLGLGSRHLAAMNLNPVDRDHPHVWSAAGGVKRHGWDGSAGRSSRIPQRAQTYQPSTSRIPTPSTPPVDSESRSRCARTHERHDPTQGPCSVLQRLLGTTRA